MKKLLICLILIPTLVFSQSKIEGIGYFKIKKLTVDSLLIYAKDKDLKLSSTNDMMKFIDFRFSTNKIVELLPDTVKPYNSPSYTHLCKSVRTFYIPAFKIADIDVTDIYLIFQNDTLVTISANYKTELVDAFKLKYGTPASSSKTDTVNCTLQLTGLQVSHTSVMYYDDWQNGLIKCTCAIGDYYNSDCEKKTLGYIRITYGDADADIRRCDEVEKKQIKNRENNLKKTKLGDL